MSNEEIKQECEKMYAKIKKSEERLKELRSICKHKNTFEGNYSWRVGAMMPAEICLYCLHVVRFIYDEPTPIQSTEQD